MTPTANIIIPNYNGGAYLPYAVESALAQSYPSTRVVVVDNASTDRSLDALDAFRDERLQITRHSEHLPMAESWNRALHGTQCDFVALLHADDVLHPSFVSTLVEALKPYPQSVVALCNSTVIDDRGRQRHDPIIYAHRSHAGLMTPADYAGLVEWMTIPPCSWLARRSLFDEMSFDSRWTWAPDWDFWLRVLDVPERGVSVPAFLSSYRLHDLGLTASTAVMHRRLEEEAAIVDAALHRRALAPRQAKRARRNISTRQMLAALQHARLGNRQAARTLVVRLVRERGWLEAARGAAGILALPAWGKLARQYLHSAFARAKRGRS
jgi:glycosyltransferase involved in cell wall biosynthesis